MLTVLWVMRIRTQSLMFLSIASIHLLNRLSSAPFFKVHFNTQFCPCRWGYRFPDSSDTHSKAWTSNNRKRHLCRFSRLPPRISALDSLSHPVLPSFRGSESAGWKGSASSCCLTLQHCIILNKPMFDFPQCCISWEIAYISVNNLLPMQLAD